MVRPKAVVMQVPTTGACYGVLTLTEESQPSWAEEAGLFVGYQGKLSPKRVIGVLAEAVPPRGRHWNFARIVLRPPVLADNGDPTGIHHLTLFDAKTAYVDAKREIGYLWFTAAAAWLRARNQPLDALNAVDFRDPVSYISAFPACAASVFEALPNLDVIVGPVLSSITKQLEWVALTQPSKLERLTEEAFVKNCPALVAVRWRSGVDSTCDSLLPRKKAPMWTADGHEANLAPSHG